MKFTSSVVVDALLSKIVVAIVCSACAIACTPATSHAELDRHVISNRLVHVQLHDFDVVSFVDVDLHTAVQTREAVESELHSAYERPGHLRWFFHAFDGEHLDFVVARFEPAEGPRYLAQRRLRLKRTLEAERVLGVTDVVREYEIGVAGIKAGMSHGEVVAALGRAQSSVSRSEKGSFDLLYPSLCVRFNGHRVEHVWRRDLCS